MASVPFDPLARHGFTVMGVGGSYGITASNRVARRREVKGTEMSRRAKMQARRKANAIWATMDRLKGEGVVFGALELERIATGALKETDVKRLRAAHRPKRH